MVLRASGFFALFLPVVFHIPVVELAGVRESDGVPVLFPALVPGIPASSPVARFALLPPLPLVAVGVGVAAVQTVDFLKLEVLLFLPSSEFERDRSEFVKRYVVAAADLLGVAADPFHLDADGRRRVVLILLLHQQIC